MRNMFKKATTRTVSSPVDHNFNKIFTNGLVKVENDWV